MRSFLVVAGALLCGGLTTGQAGPDSGNGDFFESKVRPTLSRHCYQCHSERAETVFGELRLDSAQALAQGGRSGPSVVPGDPEASRLISAVRHARGVVPMPPAGKLRDQEIADLAEWIRTGARWPDTSSVQRVPNREADQPLGEEHWAWQSLERPPVPEVADSGWPARDLDHFVLAGLEARGLRPVAPADRHTLARRLALDLTGLPPTPELVLRFTTRPSPQALEELVDTLLASPGFGERWGRHWLDLAAYADTLGLGRRIPSPHAWRYRDYVIDAFNQDKPYDRFMREQVAGDVLAFDSDAQRREQLVATGFLAIGPWALVDQDKVQLQMDVVDHQVDTLGRALLGLTVGCARCHDHKFDPLPQREYYALAGIFRSTQTLDARMSGVFSGVHRTILPETPGELRARADAFERWQADYSRALASVAKADEEVAALEEEIRIAEDAGTPKATLDELRSCVASARKYRNAENSEALRILHYLKPGPPLALALSDVPIPTDTPISLAGNPHNPGETVPRGFLSLVPLDPTPKIANRRLIGTGFQKSSGRLELAEWLADAGNPLPARVMANRVWHHLFGRGIVESVDNFGILGQRPTHPALLDHLATRLRDLDWSVKALVREIVLSSTYRLSAAHDDRSAESDPENLLLWRANRRRMEAETIRDAVLFVSRSLDFRAGGPTLPLASRGSVTMGQPPLLASRVTLQESVRHRRTVYLPALRKSQLAESDVLNLFDFPDPNVVSGRRDVTTVPTQALYLMNSPFLVRHARLAASALLADTAASDEERVRRFLLRALGRPASTEDLRRARRFLEAAVGDAGRDEAWTQYCHSVLASNEFLFRS